MTLEEFKSAYKDKTLIDKLKLMQVQHDYWRMAEKNRIDADWCGNYEEARYYASEGDAMKDRIVWLMEEITKALEVKPEYADRPRGHWEKMKPDALVYWRCSACQKVHYLDEPRDAFYCPGCGARMEEEADSNG